MSFRIKQAVVLGSGIMGSGIACHLCKYWCKRAAAGFAGQRKAKPQCTGCRGTCQSHQIKSCPLYDIKFASRISTGNFEDDLSKVAEADWIIEVVVERADIKQKHFMKKLNCTANQVHSLPPILQAYPSPF